MVTPTIKIVAGPDLHTLGPWLFEDFCNIFLPIGVARIFHWGGPNHKSHAMTSSEIFKRETFCGTKISSRGKSEAEAWFWL